MKKGLIRLGQTKDSPVLSVPGIVLKIPRDRISLGRNEPLPVYGCCRMAGQDLTVDKRELLYGLSMTVVEAYTQTPISVSLIGDQVVFEDDVIQAADTCLGFFECNLVEVFRLGHAPFFGYVHASSHQHVSNIVGVRIMP